MAENVNQGNVVSSLLDGFNPASGVANAAAGLAKSLTDSGTNAQTTGANTPTLNKMLSNAGAINDYVFNRGPLTNGGSGVYLPSRYTHNIETQPAILPNAVPKMAGFNATAIGVGAIVTLLFIAMIRRK